MLIEYASIKSIPKKSKTYKKLKKLYAAVQEAKAQRTKILSAVRQAEEEQTSPSEKLTKEGLGKRKRTSNGSDSEDSSDGDAAEKEGEADANMGEAETGVETPVENEAEAGAEGEKEEEGGEGEKEEQEEGSDKLVSSQRLQWNMGKCGS